MWRWRPSRHTFKLSLAAITLAVAAGVLASWIVADRMTQASPALVGQAPADFLAERVEFLSESGAKLVGWYQRGKSARGVVVFAHGIRGNRKQSLPRARLIAEAGYSTLLFDLRAHGESSGDRITFGKLESLDVKAAVELAREMNPHEPIGVVGFSLGGAAIALAAPLEVDAVVLEATFPTIDAAIHNRTSRRLGLLAPIADTALRLQLKPRLGISPAELRPIDTITKFGCPLMIVGGKLDHQTTPEDTRRLFNAAQEPKELVWFDDLGHTNYARRAPEEYRATVVDFLVRHLLTAVR